MFQFVLPDKKLLPVFTGLYQGDLMDYTKGSGFVIGALEDGKPAGLILSTVYSGEVSIDWVYVKEEFRGRALGSRMVKKFTRDTIDMGLAEFFRTCTTDTKLVKFFTDCGYVFSDELEHFSYRAKLSDMIELPKVRGKDHVFALSGLTSHILKGINLYFSSLADELVGVELPIKPEDYLDVPSVYIADDRLRAILLTRQVGEKEVSISYAYTYENDGMALFTIAQEAKKAITEKLGDDLIISTASLGPNTEKLMEKLFPELEKEPIYTGVYM